MAVVRINLYIFVTGSLPLGGRFPVLNSITLKTEVLMDEYLNPDSYPREQNRKAAWEQDARLPSDHYRPGEFEHKRKDLNSNFNFDAGLRNP